jgi:hypothetical protein
MRAGGLPAVVAALCRRSPRSQTLFGNALGFRRNAAAEGGEAGLSNSVSLAAWKQSLQDTDIPKQSLGTRKNATGLLLCANDDRGHVRSVNRGVEKLRAGQLGKMNELVSDFLDFPTNLLPALHPQLDHLADVFLENTDDGIARLQIDFALCK